MGVRPAASGLAMGDREAQHVALTQEECPGLSVREVSGLGDDPLQEPRQLPFARQRDADGDELFEALRHASRLIPLAAGLRSAHRGQAHSETRATGH